jgi:autotransporter-associated beta strand protein
VANGVGNKALLGAGGSTFVLDTPVTLGIVQDGQGSARAWLIQTNPASLQAMTFDNTGGINNLLANADAWLGSSSSGPMTFQPSIVIANTDLHFQLAGSTGPAFNQGVLNLTTITATSPRTLWLHSDSGGTAGMTINSSIGGSGSSITISNVGVGTRTVTLAGAVGPNVGIVQNSANSVLRLSSGANTYTGGTIITLGTIQLGVANAIPSISSVDITGTLNMAGLSDTIDALTGAGIVNNASAGTPTLTVGGNNGSGTFGGVIQNTVGTLSLAKTGSGTEILTGANTYSGTTTFNGGFLNAGSADSPGSAGPFGSATSAGSMVFSGGTLQYSAANQNDYSARFSTASGQAISIDTAGQAVTFATALTSSGGSLTKTGNGTLTLTAAETYTGNTTVNGGTLALIDSGALSTSSTVNVGAGGTFDVSALASPYTLSGSASLKASGTGTMVGTTAANIIGASGGVFDVGSQPISLTWGGASAGTDSTHPSLTVSQGTLNLNNNPITVVVPGTALDIGVYTLISAPLIAGTPNSVPAYTGGNGLLPGKIGVISVSGNTVILTVTGSSAVLGTWVTDADSTWNTGVNWSSNPNLPHAAGDVATLGVSSALRTVTLNAAITNGSLNLTNSNSFVIANGGFPLTLDNSGGGSAINVSAGTQNAISAAMALNDNAAITINSNASLNISGAIGNSAAAKTLTISGGTLALSGNNSFGPAAGSVGATLASGTLQLGHNNALGAGDLSVSGSSTLKAGAAGLTINNNIAVALGATETVDNNGNNLSLGGVISGNGGLRKVGAGTLVLGGANTFSGGIRINTGTVSISTAGVNPGDPGNLGVVPASPTANNVILNGGDLLGNGTVTLPANRGIGIGPVSGSSGTNALIDAATGASFTINGAIVSAGNGGVNSLTVNSLAPTPGTVILGGANTFGGTTVIANGALQLANSQALQNSTLNYDTGTLLFDNSITAATIGGFSCLTASQNLSLQNGSPAAVTLTIGGNNASIISGGNLSGLGSLVKAGAGTLIVSNANYSGGTTINGGSGNVTILAGTFGSSSAPFTVGGNLFLTNVTTTTASTFSVGTGGGQTGVGAIIGGAVNLTNTTTTIGSSGNTAGALTVNSSGNVNLGNVNINRDAGAVVVGTPAAGLLINGGNVVATGMNIAQSGVGGRGADLNITNGSLTIADNTQSGKFAIHAGAGNGFVTMRGGALTYLGTDGLLMSVGAGLSSTVISGGTATLTGVTLNSGGGATTSTLLVDGTSNPSLYLGSVGLVINAPSDTVAATFGNATIGAFADWSSDAPINLTNNPVFKAADAANVPHNITLNNVLSGASGLTKTGNGTLTLAGANTYTGNTVVRAGTLDLKQPSLFFTSSVSVSNSATLHLDFSVTNVVRGLVLNGVSKPSGVYNNGTDPSFLTGAGAIQVQAISLTPTNLISTFDGANLTLSWPSDHTGWRLQAQTNALSIGLATNWVDVTGATTTNQVVVPVNAANGSVFFRLVYP